MKTLLSIFFILITLSSCDDFLDITPTGKVIPTTLEENRALLLSSYEYFPADKGLTSFRTDEVMMNTSSSIDVQNYGDNYIWNDQNTNIAAIPFKWLSYYEVIFTCNYIINNKENITKGSVEDINQLVGEAYLMRAYAYHSLTNLYASPIHKSTEASPTVPINLDNDMQAVRARATMPTTLAQINNDIAKGLELMTIASRTSQEVFWWSVEAAQAFKIRHLLYQEQWDSVIDLSAELLAQTEKQLTDLNDAASILPNAYNSTENIIGIELVLPSDYARAMYVSDQLISQYTRNDKRLSRYYKAETKSIYSIRKGGSNTYRCSFRLSEVYLSMAEAYAQTNNYPAARDTLLAFCNKRLNTKGYNNYKTHIDSTEDASLVNEILEERFRELAFEGQRWFDLRRSTQKSITHTLNGTDYTLSSEDVRYTIPIPEEARQANPLLNN